ncbi:MAG TPA: 4-(cytidine 5'-diphospho)-2-C-methyl-D-erythritol kinase [Alphaproteobacteria bacterium]|nr:4-(cytidine 5'-diphospho)-2-C-methyl-D-erythritol kinase [Alphaproteobacteria bacterium]
MRNHSPDQDDAVAAQCVAAAPAKLNLYLHVTGRRADGYHLLDSLVAFASIHDTVAVTAGEGLALALEGPFASALAKEPDNLVLRAARRLAAEAKIPARAAITLIKRLPVASGIGGGSADAAAALRLLAELWQVSLAKEELHRLALALGADLPMCLNGRSAFVGGIGEELAPAPPLPAVGLLLVNPGIAVPTPKVFQARAALAAGGFSAAARFDEAPGDAAALAALLGARRNDLTEGACALCPEIREVLATLSATSGCRLARMSGSGATCFGLFDDEAAAHQAAVRLRRPGWWVAPGHLVNDAAALKADRRSS